MNRDELTMWLLDTLNEIALVADAATVDSWEVFWDNAPPEKEQVSAITAMAVGEDIVVNGSGFTITEDAVHIALHDPLAVLARVDAEREIIRLHRPTIGYRDVIEPLGGWPTQEPTDDPADLTYPEAAALCRVCGPGDTPRAVDEPYGELPCQTLRLLAWGHRHDATGYRSNWAPTGLAS